MNATESSVPLQQPASSALNAATVTITRPDGSLVLRQEIVLADALVDGLRVGIAPDGSMQVMNPRMEALLLLAMQELDCIRRAMNMLSGGQFRPQDVDLTNL